jgi:hypothetical protein
MAATYQSMTNRNGVSTTPNSDVPTGTVAGDHLLWIVMWDSFTVTPPTGFSAIAGGGGSANIQAFQKISDGTEGSPLIGSATSGQWSCFCIRTSGSNCGVDNTATGSNGDNGLATATVPAFTTGFANEEIYVFQTENGLGIGPYTPDAAFTAEIFDSGATVPSFEICHKTTTTAASYGSWVSTASGGTYVSAGFARYYVIAIGENLATKKFPPRIIKSQAMKRASFF